MNKTNHFRFCFFLPPSTAPHQKKKTKHTIMLARTIAARPRAVATRSTPPSAPQTAAAPPAADGATVFFRGQAYNEAEWAAAVASGATAASAVTDDVVAVAAPSLAGEFCFFFRWWRRACGGWRPLVCPH